LFCFVVAQLAFQVPSSNRGRDAKAEQEIALQSQLISKITRDKKTEKPPALGIGSTGFRERQPGVELDRLLRTGKTRKGVHITFRIQTVKWKLEYLSLEHFIAYEWANLFVKSRLTISTVLVPSLIIPNVS